MDANGAPEAVPEIEVRVNGRALALPADTTVAELVARMAAGTPMVAVERNGEIVPRDRWGESAVAAADQYEIVRFVQGG